MGQVCMVVKLMANVNAKDQVILFKTLNKQKYAC